MKTFIDDSFTLIKRNSLLPDDFYTESNEINRDKYIVCFNMENNEWINEHDLIVDLNTLGAALTTENVIRQIGYRLREEKDGKFSLKNTLLSNLIMNTVKCL